MKASTCGLAMTCRVLVAVVFVFCPCAFAQLALTVNATTDAIDDNPGNGVCHTAAGTCTLRAAIMEANRSGTGATINLPAGIYTLQIAADGSDDETSGDLDLTTPGSGNPVITIAGAGAATTIIDANHLDRILLVESLRTVNVSGVTIRGGSNLFGGGIVNDGILALDRVNIDSNNGGFHGGGIYNNVAGTLILDHANVGPQNQAVSGGGVENDGTTVLRNSSIVSNEANSIGGGLYNTGALTISGSTIAWNSAADSGAGIANIGSLKMVDSTVAQNHAQLSGGGLYAGLGSTSTTLISSSTIAGNSAYTDQGDPGNGGGIYIDDVVDVSVRNSLLVGNYYNGFQGDIEDCYTNGSGILHVYGANLFTAAGACTVDSGGGGGWSPLNSLDDLGPLKDNGGPTWTIALLHGSNAIDAGIVCVDPDGNTISTDQRGFARVVGSACDVGAYEFDPDRIFTNGFDE